MTALTNDAENRVLNHLCLKTAWTPTSPLRAALFTTAPTESGGGTEVIGNAYARTAITWGTATTGSITNSAAVLFPVATGNWGIVAIAIFDSAAAPVMIWYGNASATKVIETGDQYSLPIGSLTLTAD
jgi:hypothetical protein